MKWDFEIFWGMTKSRGIFYWGSQLIPVGKRGGGCKINRAFVVQNIDEVGKYSKFNGKGLRRVEVDFIWKKYFTYERKQKFTDGGKSLGSFAIRIIHFVLI